MRDIMSETASQPGRLPHTEAFSADGKNVHVIIETPQGKRNKYKYDEKYGLFILSQVLPVGLIFPFDFGYIPSTLGEDGDPLDVLVLLDEEVFPGCLVASRLIGVIEAEQVEQEQRVRNDRLIAVAAISHHHHEVQSLDQLNESIVHEIEHFFTSFNSIKGRPFEILGRANAEQAQQLVHEGIARLQQPSTPPS
jgi:inorganic pyrophosphatase